MKIAFNEKNNKISPIYVISFILLFTPLFFVGIALIVVYMIVLNIKRLNPRVENPSEPSSDFKKAENRNRKNSPGYMSNKRHWRGEEFDERMTSETRKKYQYYSEIKNNYEQTVKTVPARRNTSNRCEVCRALQTNPGTHCEVCGELFDEGIRCTFCKCKNELYATHCKNCGVKFEA